MKDILLKDWIAEQIEKLRAFELYWKSCQQNASSDFPDAVPAGDWEEQFDFFKEEV